MKTIAVVRLPFAQQEWADKVKENIDQKLSDYIVLYEFSSNNERTTIEFFSPELQQSLKQEPCGIRNYTIIDTEKMMEGVNGINSVNRRNR